jgi:hypothetical protein
MVIVQLLPASFDASHRDWGTGREWGQNQVVTDLTAEPLKASLGSAPHPRQDHRELNLRVKLHPHPEKVILPPRQEAAHHHRERKTGLDPWLSLAGRYP